MIPTLEERLADLARYVEFPPTPPMAAMVRPRLAAATRRSVIRRGRLILAAAVVAVLTVVLGVSPVRTAIAHWLGIQGVVISPATSVSPPPVPHPSASPSEVGTRLSLGKRSTLETSGQAAGFQILVPQALGPPDSVYLRSDLGPVVTLVYAPRAGLTPSGQTGVGLLVTEFRGATNPMLMRKFVGPETTVTPVTVNGGAGLWLDGGVHQVAYDLPGGGFATDTLRLAGPTLVFERGDLTIRIEGSLTQTQTLAIADSLR